MNMLPTTDGNLQSGNVSKKQSSKLVFSLNFPYFRTDVFKKTLMSGIQLKLMN